jgi:DNA polymerase-3 subunit alpha
MRAFLQNMRPESFEDIIAAISLYRPGPMESIPRYIAGKHDPASVRYPTQLLKPILDVTYGCMVYQEQVLQIVRDLAGYSYGRSDLVRRAMSKKKHDVMAKEREYFVHGMTDADGNVTVEGCMRRGVPEAVAEQLFDDMTAFASYAFNKSHAAAYAVVAVKTGWLKRHYPVQFMAAIMNSFLDHTGKVAGYIQYCRSRGIPVLPPDVNRSGWKFTVDKDQAGKPGIRFGMGAVKNVGRGAVGRRSGARVPAVPRSVRFCRARAGGSHQQARGGKPHQGRGVRLGPVQPRPADERVRTRDGPGRPNAQKQPGRAGEPVRHDGSQQQARPYRRARYAGASRKALLNMEKEMTGVYISGHRWTRWLTCCSPVSLRFWTSRIWPRTKTTA